MSAFRRGDRVRVTVKLPAFDGITAHDGETATVDFPASDGASITFDDGSVSYAFESEMEQA